MRFAHAKWMVIHFNCHCLCDPFVKSWRRTKNKLNAQKIQFKFLKQTICYSKWGEIVAIQNFIAVCAMPIVIVDTIVIGGRDSMNVNRCVAVVNDLLHLKDDWIETEPKHEPVSIELNWKNDSNQIDSGCFGNRALLLGWQIFTVQTRTFFIHSEKHYS